MLDLDVLNPAYECVGTVDDYQSLIWNRRYFEAGDFEIYAGVTDNNIELLKAGNIILKSDAEEVGQIIKIEIKRDEIGERAITATGRFLSYMLHKHLIKANYSFNGKAADAMRKLVDVAVINGQADDVIDNMTLSATDDTTATFEGVIKKYTDLYDALVAIAYASGVGFKITYDGTNYIFSCYEAKDRTIDQDTNLIIEFSQEYDNIGESTYINDNEGLINAVIAEYSGDLGTCTVTVNPTNATGAEKQEIYITGEAVTGKAYRQTDGGEWEEYDILNVTETEKNLTVKANAVLSDVAESITANANLNSQTVIYKTDYDLGDIVTITDNSLGISINQRITEITETDDENGRNLTAVFGSRYPVIMDILKN